MSWLRFSRATGILELLSGNACGSGGSVVGRWQAHNHTARASFGPWPLGEFPYTGYNPHPESGPTPACMATAYGCSGIHIFSVPGRTGMGVHAGRAFVSGPAQRDYVGGVTLGCVRTSDEAMTEINMVHAFDPLVGIQVD